MNGVQHILSSNHHAITVKFQDNSSDILEIQPVDSVSRSYDFLFGSVIVVRRREDNASLTEERRLVNLVFDILPISLTSGLTENSGRHIALYGLVAVIFVHESRTQLPVVYYVMHV